MTDPLRPDTDDEPWINEAGWTVYTRPDGTTVGLPPSDPRLMGTEYDGPDDPPRYTGAWLTAAIVAALVGVAVVIWRIVK